MDQKNYKNSVINLFDIDKFEQEIFVGHRKDTPKYLALEATFMYASPHQTNKHNLLYDNRLATMQNFVNIEFYEDNLISNFC